MVVVVGSSNGGVGVSVNVGGMRLSKYKMMLAFDNSKVRFTKGTTHWLHEVNTAEAERAMVERNEFATRKSPPPTRIGELNRTMPTSDEGQCTLGEEKKSLGTVPDN
ncbi:hypothetical protein M0802_009692 [Mischocyttarus mexicanus]|nr:hypothetical protein M0802_009692 [Mischocyttarus mexicanus]